MIFSQDRIARALEREFECVWRSVGPVPQARIDFGNGEVLETTLGGNVLTSFCLADGLVYDVLPGIMTADAYLEAARDAARFAREIAALPSEQRTLAARRHPLEDEGARAWRSHVNAARNGSPFAEAAGPGFLGVLDPFPLVERPSQVPSLLAAVSKSIGEAPLVERLRARPLDTIEVTLAADTILAERVLRPQARGVLGSMAGRSPADVTPQIFRLVLQIDMEDPYLGLGDALFGGRK